LLDSSNPQTFLHLYDLDGQTCRKNKEHNELEGLAMMQFARSQHLDANEEDLEGSEAKSTEAIMPSGLKDFSLLAAAQREISKIKEICAF